MAQASGLADEALENDVHPDVRPFVERFEREHPGEYAAALGQWIAAIKRHANKPPRRFKKLEHFEGVEREVETILQTIAIGVEPGRIPGIEQSEGWGEIRRRLNSDRKFITRHAAIRNGSMEREEERANGPRPEENNRAEFLTVNWWRLGMWLMSERSGVLVCRVQSGGKYFPAPIENITPGMDAKELRAKKQRAEEGEAALRVAFHSQAGQLKLPRHGNRKHKALLSFSKESGFQGGGAWAGS